jgi:Fanconi-associated nuclease 1
MMTDFFYLSRVERIQERLLEIKQGRAKELIEIVYTRQSQLKPSCIGVNWDAFSKQDMLEIAEVKRLSYA